MRDLFVDFMTITVFLIQTESSVIFICHYILISKLNDNGDFGKCLFLVNVLSHHGLSRNSGRQTVVDCGSMSREIPKLDVFLWYGIVVCFISEVPWILL